MHNTNSRDLWKTYTRRSLTENGWILRKRTSCLDYSKHLCCGKRLAVSIIEKRPSKSVSDTDAVALFRHFGINRRDYNSGNVTLDANAERNLLKQVYYMDKKFHRKYGNKNEDEETNAKPPKHRSWINTPTSEAYFKTDYDDCARSFCDSVSSVACTNLSNSDEMERQRKHILSNNVSKISAVESWLQGLPKPLL